ncbi:hypothetical protein [Natrinema salifodinae]|uniref:hypothetical protein n=1 Tax=Natrinema salifodinae TaxID=1202768 RepID=UPI001160229F|nr:hypothetical protein [Natrinema salifodinae]
MSYLRDALEIINDDTPVFAFLPVANVTYLLILEYQPRVFLGGILVTLLSSLLYLLIDQDPAYDSQKNWVRVIFVTWLVLYAESIRRLFEELNRNLVFPEILIFVSTTFISLVVCDKILKNVLDDYTGTI